MEQATILRDELLEIIADCNNLPELIEKTYILEPDGNLRLPFILYIDPSNHELYFICADDKIKSPFS